MGNVEVPSAETDAWNIAEATIEGKPSILRYRPELKAWLGDTRYPRILRIVWRYEETNATGMPSDDQSASLGDFENTLQSAFDKNRLAVLAFVLTGRGSREWNYYVADTDQVGEAINQSLEPGLPIELSVQDDADWQELRLVYKSCGEDV